jgi:uncharacterized protein (TIGR02246 family)
MTATRRIKWALLLPLVAAVLLLGAGCASPAPPSPKTPPPQRDIQAEVLSEFEHSVAAWNTGNLDGFMAIYADNATFAMRDHFLMGAAAIRSYYAPRFAAGADRGVLTMQELNVDVLAPDVVLVRGLYQSRLDTEVTRGTTSLVLHHILNHWRIIHDHST